MTTQQPATPSREYSPFHHLQDLHYVIQEGDGLLRLAFLEAMDKLDLERGPYLTALEAAAFPAKLALAIYARVVPEDGSTTTNEIDVEWYLDNILERLGENVTVRTDSYDAYDIDVYNLAFADQERMLAAVAKWTDQQVKTLRAGDLYADNRTQAKAKKAKKVCEAVADEVSETFNVKGFGKLPVTLHQGGQGVYPLRVRQVSKETGRFHMTRNGLKEWGFAIPRHPEHPDDTGVAVNVAYPTPPDGVMLKVASSTDDVPDGEGGTKSEQITITIKKGDNTMQLSLLNKNLRQHSWTFSIEEADN